MIRKIHPTLGLRAFTALFAISLCCQGKVVGNIDFNRDIRPILSNKCFTCHGPDEESRKGGSRKTGRLRLDTPEGARMDLGDYAALVPGKPDESELIYLVETDDEDDRMPPQKNGSRLAEDEIALLRQWIEEGGEYDIHWSYKKPELAEVPKVSKRAFRLNNAIDHFISEKLVSEKLAQSPTADKHALARRAALDLTGLPPTPEEVRTFLDDKNNDAYEQYVQRLLEKPAYGEHWARMWLDLARYADSAGYADDPLREIWGFRDYVIRSFNENKPFDQFTLEQIAGDLLKEPTTDQLIATAFHRNTKTNSEGGTNDEEFRNEAVVDRVNTTMAVWMGTTIDCAQCHTHKYDPISQEEYFKLFAILNNTADEDRKDEKPLLPLFNEKQERDRQELQEAIVQLEQIHKKNLAAPENQLRRAQWEQAVLAGTGWTVLHPKPESMSATSNATFSINDEGFIEVGDNAAPRVNYTITVAPPKAGTITGIKLEVPPHEQPWVLNEFELRLIKAESDNKPKLKLHNDSATYEQEWYVAKDLVDGISGDRFSGWAVGGALEEHHAATFELEQPIQLKPGEELQIQFKQVFPLKTLKRFRLSVSHAKRPTPAIPSALLHTFEKSHTKMSQEETARFLDFFSRFDPQTVIAQAEIASLQKKLDAITPLTTVPIFREVSKKQRRKSHIQYRGSFLDLGPEVEPGTPEVFHPLPENRDPNRLALAQWLVDRNNPLTARVVVNRYWEALFGIGIVPTSEDFGSQGETPTHPELLDWLAVEFVKSGWDIKHLLSLIVTSATYQQDSKVSAKLFERDPDNRLLARGPRVRISAEMVRDQALAVSGLLSPKMYGPSVRPLQPDMGLTAAFGGKTDWKTSEGRDKHRRGIYTTWRRSNPYPSMAAFDAPNREFCTIRRANTNTPLQALVTLNDPVYIEASQALGRKMEAFKGTTEEKAAYGFELCLIRPASKKEVAALTKLYNSTKQQYQNDAEGAWQMATEPMGEIPVYADAADFAAWTVVGNTLLNLDEMFLKR